MSRSYLRRALVAASLSWLLGCDGSGADQGTVSGAPVGDGGTGDAAPATPSGSAGVHALLGAWTVRGTDSRGAFEGQIELRAGGDGKQVQFARAVRYLGVTVEDARELHWAFSGVAEGTGTEGRSTLRASLDPRGFIARRGALRRAITDVPQAFAADVVVGEGSARARWSEGGKTWEETWTDPRPVGLAPLFAVNRKVTPAHAAPSKAEKEGYFATFASYQALPSVAPYRSRPEFDAAVFGNTIDTTDFDFYRQHPRALRVVERPIDGISQQEALVRARAFAPTLEQKARAFDEEMETVFMEPGVWFAPDSIDGSGAMVPSGDGSLWTGTYIASQIYRYQVTGEAKAKENARRSLDAILKLQEITGDSTQFARTLRKSRGPAVAPWHAGAGAFVGLDWLEGGNNDMMKGLYLAYTLGYPLFCTGAELAQNGALCARLHDNAEHLADIQLSRGTNALQVAWIPAVINGGLGHRADAEKEWLTAKVELQNNYVVYHQGIADWSGTHLTFVGLVVNMLLAERMDLGGDAREVVGDNIVHSHDSVAEQRLLVWHFLRQAYGSSKPAPAYLEDGKWRLREMPFPKGAVAIDHRISPEFCMGPYPSLPWKNDWLTEDQTQSLVSYPLFENRTDVMTWKNGLEYAFDTTQHYPGTDYLHLYWFGRRHGIIAAGD